MEITIKTQAELDALPKAFTEYTVLRIESTEWITVVARGNSRVEAWENSRVVAWENSTVVAWENSRVVAWENSTVVAWGNSRVEARGNVCVWNQSDDSIVTLFAFAVAFLFRKAKATRKSKTSTIIRPVKKAGLNGWLEDHAIKPEKSVVLFKRVSKDFLTQEGQSSETNWTPGETRTHADWTPKGQECGAGTFHACARPYFCDEFRSTVGDRYIAIKIDKKDLYAWPEPEPKYPHKIAFRKGTVLYEVDRFGDKIV